MNESAHRTLDIAIKAVTASVAIGVALYGLFEYRDNVKHNQATRLVEQGKLGIEKVKLTFELNRQKAEVLSRAAQAAADAVWTDERLDRQMAINRYTRLFVGELSLVANDDVIRKGDVLNERLSAIRISLEAISRTHAPRASDREARRFEDLHGNAVTALNDFVDACRNQIVMEWRGGQPVADGGR
jgi:hypothetical protein